MFWPLQAHSSHIGILSSQFVIMALASHFPKPWVWVLGGALMALVSLFAWFSSIGRARIIANTPKSNIASAAQGYVELQGQASPKPEYLLIAKSGLPCVWFSCVSYRKEAKGWEEVDCTVSDSIFELNDGSGEPCIIDPEHAKVITGNSRTWYSDNYKYVEEQLFPGQQLYVLGEFSTMPAETGQAELNTELSLLLGQWKKDRQELLRRFDSNRDGKIDMEEWEQARNAAYRQLSQQEREIVQYPGIHIIKRPKDGRPFLISNLPEQKLHSRWLIWAGVHLTVFFASSIGAFWLAVKHGVLH